MSFNPNIPQVTDKTLKSFRQLRANFQAINAAYSDNHVPLTAGDTFQGMHNDLTFQIQNSDPATSATQIALYTKLVSSIPQIFFRPNSSQTPIQLTYSSIKADESNTQYSFVAGPFIVYGGFVSNPSQGQTVTLTPTSTLIFVSLTNADLDDVVLANVIPTNVTGSSFDISFFGTATQRDVIYLAIGKP